MKSKFILSLIAIILFITNCISIEIVGRKNGFKELGQEDRKLVKVLGLDEDLCNNTDRTFKVINAQHLRKCLTKNDSSIVYTWGPGCSSEACTAVKAMQDFCDHNGYKLYVVANYFAMKEMKEQNVADFPMLIANHAHYDKYKTKALNKRFKKDLLNGATINEGDEDNRYLIFKGDQYIRSIQKFDDDIDLNDKIMLSTEN